MLRVILIGVTMALSIWMVSAFGLTITLEDLFAYGAGMITGLVFWLTKPRRIEYVEVPAEPEQKPERKVSGRAGMPWGAG